MPLSVHELGTSGHHLRRWFVLFDHIGICAAEFLFQIYNLFWLNIFFITFFAYWTLQSSAAFCICCLAFLEDRRINDLQVNL